MVRKSSPTYGSEITSPYDPTKIDITIKYLSLDLLIKRMIDGRIDLNTEFQRNSDLWNDEVQSRLIESLLVRIPLPAFYFDGTDNEKWQIVDGLQRLITLKNFVIDKKLKLQGLEYLTQFDGCDYDELPLYLQGRIAETQITAFIINPGTPRGATFNIFKRINTSGLVLTPQEIRHALNQGIAADFVRDLAELPEFIQVVKNKSKRMLDRELVTRFVGFYHNFERYNIDLENYLDEVMRKLAKTSQEERDRIKDAFIRAMRGARRIFGDNAFAEIGRLEDKNPKFNRARFDAWSVNLARLSEDDIEKLAGRKDMIKTRFRQILQDDKEFKKALGEGTGRYTAVEKRISTIGELLQGILHDPGN